MTTNPYRAPRSEDLRASASPEPGDLIPRRLNFRGEIHPSHHREAVTRAGIRKEFQSVTRTLLAFGGVIVLLAVVVLLISDRFNPTNVLRAVTASILVLGGVTIFCINHRWHLGTQVPGYQMVTGTVRGWIDREGLWIETPEHQAFHPINSLVASAATHDLWVLSFARELTFWQTLPMDGFDDPFAARSVAHDLQYIRPPVAAQLTDERRRTIPDQPALFGPLENAIHFEGEFYEDAARDTRLIKATRGITRKTWTSLAVLLASVLASLLVLTNFRMLYVALAVAWFLFFFGNIYVRVWNARRKAMTDGRRVAWYAKGWVDDEGFCAITSIGQSRSRWDFFDHFEITFDAIGLYPHRSDACCCLVAREQFANDEDWRRAADLVRKKFHSRRRSHDASTAARD